MHNVRILLNANIWWLQISVDNPLPFKEQYEGNPAEQSVNVDAYGERWGVSLKYANRVKLPGITREGEL
jgi:hypothetical protein